MFKYMEKLWNGLLLRAKSWLLLLLVIIYFLNPDAGFAQIKKNDNNTPAFATGKYRNFFREAGYSQADIDRKINKAYYDLFEGPHPIYFKAGDSMAYISD